MYADDSTITVSHTDINTIETKFGSDLNRVEEWCKESKMVINANKTHAMLITTQQKRSHLRSADLNLKVNNETLEMSRQEKVLGVIVDEHLNWKQHIIKVLRSANAHLSMLKRIKHCLPLSTRKTFYNAYILPHIEYCITLWGTSPDIDKISKLQKRAARIILDAQIETPSSQLFERLFWMPIKDRVQFKSAVFVFKALNGLAPKYICDMFKYVSSVSSRTTRSSVDHKLYIDPKQTKKCIRNSISYRGAIIWNNLDNHITSAKTLQSFKSRYLKAYFTK
jgi:hypothetical protein